MSATSLRRRLAVQDVLMITLAAVFFGLSLGFAALCDRLMEQTP